MGLSHLLHFRRLFPINPNLHKTISIIKPFSSTAPNSHENPTPKPTSLSARMSFVFDQIEAIEKERSQKDETLTRIRAWRESKKEKLQENVKPTHSLTDEDTSVLVSDTGIKEKGLLSKGVELVHPWPEWIELMERLVQQNYFDCKRKDEDKLISESGFGDVVGDGGGIMADVMEEGFDFTRDWKTVQTAGLNFGKDRFDILSEDYEETMAKGVCLITATHLGGQQKTGNRLINDRVAVMECVLQILIAVIIATLLCL